ncbi:enoyl-CoA hydratase [Litorivicinus sp.]|nr:enoyl-CoA hydratase [Litorivicinus sp.]MDC1240748.1 enoyl-CoA hydratase [Litorivicinus sp.]MDC1467078.1 enoyl-CoA hydratase [Litorivicinus sp.]
MVDYVTTNTDGIAEFRLNRPKSRNSLTFEMYQALEDLCQVPPTGTGAIVLTAEGEKAFASGTDISKFREFHSTQDAIEYEAMIGRVIQAVEQSPVPVIASLHGVVAGGGAAIAAAADIRLSTPDIRFGMPMARTLGNCLSVANLNRLVRLLGESRVRYLLLTANFIEIDSLIVSGFISEVLPDVISCDQQARALASHLMTLAPRTISTTREGLRRLAGQVLPEDEDLITHCYLSQDFAEGIDAFFAKRKANWSGQ